jgi:hypothetical protein
MYLNSQKFSSYLLFFITFVFQNFPLFLLVCDHKNMSEMVLKHMYSDKVSYIV